jgi:hypothetical protein
MRDVTLYDKEVVALSQKHAPALSESGARKLTTRGLEHVLAASGQKEHFLYEHRADKTVLGVPRQADRDNSMTHSPS